MKFAKGAKSRILIAFEEDEGVLGANPKAFLIPFNKAGLTSKTDMKDAQTITGRRDPVQPIKGNRDVSGNLTIPLDLRIFGLMLRACFDSPTTTSLSTSGWLKGGVNVDDTLATWKAITTGAFKITIDGVQKSISGLDFSGATSMADVATAIQVAIRAANTTLGYTAATVTYSTID